MALINSVDSRVVKSAQDQRNVALCGSESLAYFSLGHGASKRSDFCDFFNAQQLVEEGNEASINSVLLVEPIVGPLKIGDHVIRFDTIDMVDHREIVWVRNEGKTDKSMDMDRLYLAVSEKIDVPVSQFIGARTQNLSVYSSCPDAVTNPVKAAYSAKVTDLVEVSEVIDRNRSPFFCDDDIHSTGCPSGTSGLMIKDPSRAATFGGSGIMASGSNTYNRSIPCQ